VQTGLKAAHRGSKTMEYKVGDHVMNDGEEVEILQILVPKCAGAKQFYVDGGYAQWWVTEDEISPILKPA
jgi:hypothetical protein